MYLKQDLDSAPRPEVYLFTVQCCPLYIKYFVIFIKWCVCAHTHHIYVCIYVSVCTDVSIIMLYYVYIEKQVDIVKKELVTELGRPRFQFCL